MSLTVKQAKSVIERYATRAGWIPHADPASPDDFLLVHPFQGETIGVMEAAPGVVEVVASRRLWSGTVHELGHILDAQFVEETSNVVRLAHVRKDDAYLSMLFQTFAADSEDLLETGLGLMAKRMLVVYERVLDAVFERFATNDVPLSPAREAYVNVALAVSELNTVTSFGGGMTQESGVARVVGVSLPKPRFVVRLRPTRRPMSVEVTEGTVKFMTFLAGLPPVKAPVDVTQLAHKVVDMVDTNSQDVRTGELLGYDVLILQEERPLPASGDDVRAVVKSHASVAAQLQMPDLPGSLNG